MELRLPQKQDVADPILLNTKTLVVIGANGAGKSSFGKELMRTYPDQAEKISGMRALFIQTENDIPLQEDQVSRVQKMIVERMFVPRLSEYEKLMIHLQAEEFDAAVDYKENSKQLPGLPLPLTKIDRIQQLWEKVFPHNKLLRKSGFIELASANRNGEAYGASKMSDGEKIVFYLIGAVLCTRPNALLIIEGPDLLLHDSIKNMLWNDIEELRPDCTFVYLTHDIDFVVNRQHSTCVWVHSYNAEEDTWDYEILEGDGKFPEELYIEILGSRKPILFIEGTDFNSIDNRLYPMIFPDYLVKPMGGCQKVIETTKAFRQLKDFHTLDSKGIVDRDRRTKGEIRYLRDQHIYVPDVAEVENLLLLEPIIRTVANRLMKDPEIVFTQVKENVIRLFCKDLEAQIILHARHRVRKKLEKAVNRKITTIEELSEHVRGLQNNIHVDTIYRELSEEFSGYIASRDYKSILRIYNHKGILPQSRLCNIIGVSNKESYFSLILSILKENKEDAEVIRNTIKGSLGM